MAHATKQRVLRSGVVIADKYRIDKAIARGGFSVIYRGTHIGMDRPVALKLLSLDEQIKPAWLDRFTREARLASQLTHSSTVTIYDYGQDERGFLYIVMEWVEGRSLYRHLKENGALDPLDVAKIAASILQSLDEAHRRGFLHRDLKPSNIMLTEDYEGQDAIKVLDFGIAKHLEERAEDATITHQGAFVGTPRYASPEQLDGKELTPAADIYSLGLLMWEALVGDPPVASIHYGDCVEAHLGPDPWRLPRAVQCPHGLTTILYKALAKAVADRYQTCREMHRDLEQWLSSSEARDLEGGDIFFEPPSSGPMRAGGLGDIASNVEEVDEEELFAGLTEPSGELSSARDLNETSGAGEDDTFERELLELADETSEASEKSAGPPDLPRPSSLNEISVQRSASKKPPNLPTPRASAPAPKPAKPAEPARRAAPAKPAASAKPAAPSAGMIDLDDKKQLTLIVSAVAGVLIVGAAAFAILSGDDDPPADASPAAVEAVEEPAEEEPAPADLDDGSPTYSADTLMVAVREAGWSRIGEVDTLDFGDVTQTSVRFRKKGKTVTLTIYETDSFATAADYVDTIKKPAQAIRFGTTVVHVAPGAKGNSAQGVYKLMSILYELKSIAQEQAER